MPEVGQLMESFYDAFNARGLPLFIPQLIVMLAVATAVLIFTAVSVMFMVWWERKISAHIQVRFGPMRVGGWHGWAQSIADGIKLLIKEDIVPDGADRLVFALAPMVVFAAALAAYVIIPFGPGLIVSDLNIGVLFYLSISSMTVVGIIMAGWSCNNKYSVLGALRSAAQAVVKLFFPWISNNHGLAKSQRLCLYSSFCLTSIAFGISVPTQSKCSSPFAYS